MKYTISNCLFIWMLLTYVWIYYGISIIKQSINVYSSIMADITDDLETVAQGPVRKSFTQAVWRAGDSLATIRRCDGYNNGRAQKNCPFGWGCVLPFKQIVLDGCGCRCWTTNVVAIFYVHVATRTASSDWTSSTSEMGSSWTSFCTGTPSSPGAPKI